MCSKLQQEISKRTVIPTPTSVVYLSNMKNADSSNSKQMKMKTRRMIIRKLLTDTTYIYCYKN